MSKKKQLTVVQEPTVSNNINMNLNHHDILEVAIQSQLEILEPKLEVVNAAIKETDEKLKNLEKVYIDQALKNIESLPSYVKFLSLVKKVNGKTPRIYSTSISYNKGGKESLVSPEFISYTGHREVEEAQRPLSYFKQNSTKQWKYANTGDVIYFNVDSEIDGSIRLTCSEPMSIKLSSKEEKSFQKDSQVLLNQYAALKNEQYTLQRQILELKYDDKKVKARFVKESLKKSEQGKEILYMLEKVSGAKLLIG